MIEYYLRAYHNFLFLSFHFCSKGKFFEHDKIRTVRTITSENFMPTGFFFLFFLQRVHAMDGCAQRSETYCSGKLFVCMLVMRAYRTEEGKKRRKRIEVCIVFLFSYKSSYKLAFLCDIIISFIKYIPLFTFLF